MICGVNRWLLFPIFTFMCLFWMALEGAAICMGGVSLPRFRPSSFSMRAGFSVFWASVCVLSNLVEERKGLALKWVSSKGQHIWQRRVCSAFLVFPWHCGLRLGFPFMALVLSILPLCISFLSVLFMALIFSLFLLRCLPHGHYQFPGQIAGVLESESIPNSSSRVEDSLCPALSEEKRTERGVGRAFGPIAIFFACLAVIRKGTGNIGGRQQSASYLVVATLVR
ncbi:hypothetical protein F5884DRAFT_236839 [Xylogone sp. PMI_703]|nr:hypothetical protein F5884DRAFT_236839 [Xylogone sp. PMI_703]